MKSAIGLIQVGWRLNLLEYLGYFRYIVFKFHECVSFLYKLMCQTVYPEQRALFSKLLECAQKIVDCRKGNSYRI
jgi:hypothetical protein